MVSLDLVLGSRCLLLMALNFALWLPVSELQCVSVCIKMELKNTGLSELNLVYLQIVFVLVVPPATNVANKLVFV